MEEIKTFKYSPMEAYRIMCSEIETKYTEWLNAQTIPLPAFCMVGERYYFLMRCALRKEGDYGRGWEFDPITGDYHPEYTYRSLYVWNTIPDYARFELTDTKDGILTFREIYRNPACKDLRSKEADRLLRRLEKACK